MNFKIYVESGLEELVEGLDDYFYTQVSINHYIPLIQNHLASKISQSFLFIVSYKLLEPISIFMRKHGESKYQFVVIGSSVLEDGIILPIVITSYSIHYTKLYDSGPFAPTAAASGSSTSAASASPRPSSPASSCASSSGA